MKRLHTTNEPTIDLSRRYQSNALRPFKPVGLWYGIDKAWFEWCSAESFGGIGEFTYELELDLSKILVISKPKDLLLFYNTFRVKIYDGFYGIDWDRLKDFYSGIEIQNYHKMRWNILPLNGDTWFYGWDCDSGCIWDLSIVKNFESVEDKPLV